MLVARSLMMPMPSDPWRDHAGIEKTNRARRQ